MTQVATEYVCPEITAFWGIFTYKMQWGLSGLGWLLFLLTSLIVVYLLIKNIQPFLAPNLPIDADTMILEGWVSDEIVEAAMREFQEGNYKLMITTGPPLGKGHFLSQYKNFADLTAATLIGLGFDAEKLIPIPSPSVELNRTYAAALEVRKWLTTNPHKIQAINLFSCDVHTRRSWILYRRTLSPQFTLGAIAYPSQLYKPQTWWRSSAGVRFVLPEAIGYLYVKLFEPLTST